MHSRRLTREIGLDTDAPEALAPKEMAAKRQREARVPVTGTQAGTE